MKKILLANEENKTDITIRIIVLLERHYAIDPIGNLHLISERKILDSKINSTQLFIQF